MKRLFWLAVAVPLAACSGNSSSSGSSGSTGSTGGTLTGDFAFAPNTTLAWTQSSTNFGGSTIADARTFDISGNAITCQSRKTDAGFESSVGLFDVAAAGTVLGVTAVTPGHYPDDAGNQVTFLVQVDQGSGIQLFLTGDGTIDVDAITPNFKGSFTTQLPLDDGGTSTLSGTFDAPYCN